MQVYCSNRWVWYEGAGMGRVGEGGDFLVRFLQINSQIAPLTYPPPQLYV